MATYLNPVPINYTKLALPKSIGGSIQFLNVSSPVSIRFIDTFDLNISMFTILDQYYTEANPHAIVNFGTKNTFNYNPTMKGILNVYVRPQFIGKTIFSLVITYADNKTENIWSYKLHDNIVGFTLPQTFFDLQTYRDIINITLIANNEITFNKHDFIIWGGRMKIIQKKTNTFIGGDLHVSDLMPISFKLYWGKTNYDYAVVNWNSGVTNGTIASIIVSYINLLPYDANTLEINLGPGNYDSINITSNNQLIATNIKNTQYKIKNLLPNSLYTYTIIPLSTIGVLGENKIVTNATLPTIGIASACNITSSSAIIYIDGGGDFAYINLTDNLSYNSQKKGYQYQVPLLANINYTFNIIPYNLCNIASSAYYQPYTKVQFTSLATVYGVSLVQTTITNSYARIIWTSGDYASITAQSIDNTINIQAITNNYIDIYNLAANTNYTINICPINRNGDANFPGSCNVYFITSATLDAVYASNITASSVYLYWSASNTYNTVDINYNTNTIYNIGNYKLYINNLNPSTIYTFYGYPRNSLNIINKTNAPSITINTLATVYSYTINTLQTNSVNISWNTNGLYSSLYLNNILYASQIYQTSCNIKELIENTQYSIAIVPYNQFNMSNLVNPIQSLCTLGTISKLSYCNVTTNSVFLYWSGLYSNVKVLCNYNNTLITSKIYNNNSISINNLYPNVLYSIEVYPYNNLNVLNIEKTINNQISFTTQASVTNMSFSNINMYSLYVKWPDSSYYSSMQVYIEQNPVLYGIATNNSYFIQNLLPNTKNTISIIPVNSAGSSNLLSIISLSAYTLARLDYVSLNTYDDNSAIIKWGGILSNLQIQYTSSPTNNKKTIIIDTTLYSQYKIGSLQQNTVYYFTYTAININNDLNLNNKISSEPLTTLALLKSIYPATNITDTAIQLSWDQGSATSVTILQYDMISSLITTIVDNITLYGTTTCNISGLLPNRTYIYKFLPINNAGISNILFADQYSQIITTQAIINSNIYIPTYTDTTATIAWNKTSSYNNINISWTNISKTIYGSILGITDNYVIASNLISNDTYVFSAVPINSSMNENINAIQNITLNTFANITSVFSIPLSSSKIQLNFGSGTYKYVSINNNYYSNKNTFIASNLYPNTLYSYAIMPYNNSDIENPNNIVNTSNYTLATITSMNLSPISSNILLATWITNATYVNINYGSINIISGLTANLAYISNQSFIANTQYSISITPFNNSIPGLANNNRLDGGTIIQSAYTHGSINSVSFCNIGTTSVDVYFYGQFTNANITVNEIPYFRAHQNRTSPDRFSDQTNDNLQINRIYTFSVIPVNRDGNAYTNGAFVSSRICTLASINNGYTITQLTGSNIQVQWTGIFTSTNVYLNSQFVANTTDSFYNYIGLSANTQYTIAFSAINALGISNIPVSFIPSLTSAIIGPLSVNFNTIDPTISWNTYSNNFNYVNVNCISGPGQNSSTIRISSPTLSVRINNLYPNTFYTYIATPYDNYGNPNVNPSYITFITLPKIDYAYINELTDVSATLNWNSTYSYCNVSIQLFNTYSQQNVLGIQTIFTNTFTRTNYNSLTANTTYNYTIIPYNIYNNQIQTGPTYTGNFTTLSSVGPISIDYYNQYSLNLSWNYTSTNPNSFQSNNLLITDSSGTSIVNIYTNNLYYNINSLIPNTLYNIKLTSYNSSNVTNTNPNKVQTKTINELAAIGQIILESIGTSNVNISWNKSAIYSYVFINIIQISTNSIIDTSTYISNTLYSISKLIANTTYNAQLVPVNNAGVSNFVDSSNIQFTTLPIISQINLKSTDSNIDVSWSNGLYSNVIINKNYNYYDIVYQSPITVNNLTPNTNYTITAIPVNSSNVLGTLSEASIYTRGSVGNIIFDRYTTNSINVKTDDGLYNTIKIQWNSNSIPQSNISNLKQNIISNLSPNTYYNFAITPYNISQDAGTTINNNTYTLASITNCNILNVSTNSFIAYVNGIYTSYILQVNGISYASASNYYTFPQVFAENILYSLIIIPINTIGLSNLKIPPIYTVTLSTVTNLINITSSNSIFLSWNTSPGINYVNIYQNNTQIYNLYSAKSANIINLLPNSFYTYKIVPVNSSSNINTNGTIITSNLTLADTTGIFSTYIATNSLGFSWTYSGSADYMNIVYSSCNINVYNSYASISNLTPNTTYIFNLYPANSSNILNYYPSVSGIQLNTLATINTASILSYSDRSATISWAYGNCNAFNYVLINNNKSAPYQTEYTLSNLIPNTNYNISIRCFNNSNIETVALRQFLPTLTTLPTITSFISSNVLSSNITLKWSGSNSYVNINIINNSTNTSILNSNIYYNYFNTTCNLYPNTNYTIYATPYNSVGISNMASISNISLTTLAQCLGFSNLYYITDSTIQFYLLGDIYTSNLITWVNNDATSQSQQIFTTNSVYVSGLSTSTVYTFTVYPINSADVINYYEYRTISFVTKCIVYLSVTPIQSVTSNSLTINWQPGIYDYVIVSWYIGSTLINNSPQLNVYSYNITNLYGNTYYNIIVTPYIGISFGLSANISVLTLANVNTSATIITSSNIELSNIGNYLYNYIEWNGYSQSNYTSYFNAASNLLPNSLYSFKITSFNNNNIPNNAAINTINITTLATIGISSNYNILSTSLIEYWQNYNAANVSIIINGGGTLVTQTNITKQNQPISGLTPNTNYIFTIIPYNSSNQPQPNIAGASINYALTLSYIDRIIIPNAYITATTAIVQWSSATTYNSIDLLYGISNSGVYNTISKISNSITQYQLNYLNPNTIYTVSIIPYNSQNVSNIIEQTTVNFTTLATINYLVVQGKTSSNINIALSGSYSNIYLSWGSGSMRGNINNTVLTDLSPNVNYTIMAIPYNIIGSPGLSTSINVYTLPIINGFTYTSTGTTVTLLWNDHTYNYIQILFNGNTYVNSNQYNPDYTSYTFKGLTTNTVYSVKLIPYNNNIPADSGPIIDTIVATAGTYQFTTFNFISNNVSSASAIPLSSIIAIEQNINI